MQGAGRIQSEIRVCLSDKKKEIIVNNYKSVFRLIISNLISVLEFKFIELFLPRKKWNRSMDLHYVDQPFWTHVTIICITIR